VGLPHASPILGGALLPHAQQFFLDCAPLFALHVGGEAKDEFTGKACAEDGAASFLPALTDI
jgi:hypothetical protein